MYDTCRELGLQQCIDITATSSCLSPHGTSVIHATPHIPLPPTAGEESSVTGIIAGVCVSAVLVVALGTLAVVIAIHRRKAACQNTRKGVDTRENVADISNPNESYATSAVTDANPSIRP